MGLFVIRDLQGTNDAKDETRWVVVMRQQRGFGGIPGERGRGYPGFVRGRTRTIKAGSEPNAFGDR